MSGSEAGPLLLSTAQTAALLGITVADLVALRAKGGGPEWGRFEGVIRYDARAVRAWLTRNEK